MINIKELVEQRDKAIDSFNWADDDLIDAAIYDIMACDMKLNAFLRYAKEAGINELHEEVV